MILSDSEVIQTREWLARLSHSAWSYDEIGGAKLEWMPRQNPRVVSSSAGVNPLDDMILCSGAITMTLETAVGADGRWHTFVKADAGTTLTIACTGGQTLGGAASKTLTSQYACLMVKSDGTNWQALQTDLTTALGILAIVNGGTGASTASGAWKNLSVDQTPLPLMDWKGVNFNGTTTYYYGNALSGIADGKKGTFVAIFRFANTASTIEAICSNTGATFQVSRTATGEFRIRGENSAGTQIFNLISSEGYSAAGTYVVMASWDLATGGSASRFYVNDISDLVTNTITNDTIDYTVTGYSIGGTTSGTSLLTGDGYVIWFDPTSNLEFNTESVRRKFINTNLVPVFLGLNGELPTGTVPILFLGYDDSTEWDYNRGVANATFFTQNGAIANATTVLNGQYSPIKSRWIPFTATRTGWTDVGTPTVTAQYMKTAGTVFFQVQVVPATSVATVAGTSYISIPLVHGYAPYSLSGSATMMNYTTKIAIGICAFDGGKCYAPTQTAASNTLHISGWIDG